MYVCANVLVQVWVNVWVFRAVRPSTTHSYEELSRHCALKAVLDALGCEMLIDIKVDSAAAESICTSLGQESIGTLG